MDKAPGSVIYTCMLNARGGVEGDLTVTVIEPGNGQPHAPTFKEEKAFYVAVGGGAAQQGLDHMKKVRTLCAIGNCTCACTALKMR